MIRGAYTRDIYFGGVCTEAGTCSGNPYIGAASIEDTGRSFFRDVSLGNACVRVIWYTNSSCLYLRVLLNKL